jgi:hypothetical protein
VLGADSGAHDPDGRGPQLLRGEDDLGGLAYSGLVGE